MRLPFRNCSIGLGINAIWHIRWSDPLAALLIVPLILWEGWKRCAANLVVAADLALLGVSAGIVLAEISLSMLVPDRAL
jgi:hypothetical protein